MARPMKPLVRGGGFYPSRKWTPLVYAGGYTTANGGGEPEPPPIEKTITGNPIHITDALAKPAQALSVKLEPVQAGSGDPSPDNVRPISGHTSADVTRTGANVWNEEWEIGGIDSSTGENVPIASIIRTKNYIPIFPDTTYFFHAGDYADANVKTRFYDGSKNYIGYVQKSGTAVASNEQFTTPTNARYLRFQFPNSYGTTYKHDISVNYPSTDTTYNAYVGTTYPIPLGQTVYGGTLDVLTGVLTVTKAFVTYDGSSDEPWVMYGTGSASAYAMRIIVADFKFVQYVVTAWSNYLESIDNGMTWGNYDAFISFSRVGIVTGIRTITSVADWRAYLAEHPLQVVYDLATPQTIQLTPTQVELLQGENNIWSDGEMTLVYLADGNASDVEALNILLGGRYVNNHEADEPSDREALDILLGR